MEAINYRKVEAEELEEAIEMLHEFSNIDDFVCRNIKQYMSGGEPTDNSIELASHWENGLRLVIQFAQSQTKHNENNKT